MAAKKVKPAAARGPGQEPDLEGFVAALRHPRRDEVLAVRDAVLAASPGITAGVLWNSISFRAEDWFATVHLRAKVGVALILHTGAKKKVLPEPLRLADPGGLVSWLAPDRCLVTLGRDGPVASELPALQALVQEWLRQYPTELAKG